MVQESKIEWCTHTSNPVKYRDADGRVVWACVKKSTGCANCYAETLAQRYGRGGPFTKPVMAGLTPFVDGKELRELLSPRKLPAGSKCFVGDMTDVFGEWVTDEMLDQLFAVFALRPDVVFQVLTKRPERMREYCRGEGAAERGEWPRWPLPNVWLGTSVENQAAADERIPELLATPAMVRFLSCEPLLGPVVLSRDALLPDADLSVRSRMARIHWVITGGESGPGARAMDLAWIGGVVEQCQAAGVPVFVKQLGSKPICVDTELWERDGRSWETFGPTGARVPMKLRDRKGGEMWEWPEDLRVREWPAEVVHA